MGIYDRDYIRNQPSSGSHRPSPKQALGKIRFWSANTWLIVACVAVFLIDHYGLPWAAVDINPTVQLESNVGQVPPGYDVEGYGTKVQDKRGRTFAPLLASDDGPQIGWIEVRPLLEKYLYFSTTTVMRQIEFWRLLGFQFLHYNFMHLLFNMLGLYFFGSLVERYLGSKRYLAFYLLCGIFGALFYLVLNLGGIVANSLLGGSVTIPGLLFNSPNTPLVGASAGVFGVLLAGAYLAPNAMVLVFFVLPMRLATFAYVLIGVAFLTVLFQGPNAGGQAAHIGGALAGFYFIRRPHHLHGFFDLLGRADPTSSYHQGRRIQSSAGKGKLRHSQEVDRILDKIRERGMGSLTTKERQLLRDASRGEKG